MSEPESIHFKIQNKNNNNDCSQNENFQTREDYIRELEKWVIQARLWQTISSSFPYYLMCNNSTTQSNVSNTQRENQTETLPRFPDLVDNEAYEFIIPPIWKRVAAEAVDFMILIIVKLALTLIALEVFDTSYWQFLKEDFMSNLTEIHLGTEITTGILILEGIHRIIVCTYEVYWLCGSNEMRFGCATPGKSLLGITVVLASKVRLSEFRNDRPAVLVHPAKDLGFLIAFGRSFVKNLILTLIFPFCFALFMFRFNRTSYDIICNTLVVEYDPNPPRRNFLA